MASTHVVTISVGIATSSIANPTVITTLTPHGISTGASVTITGHTGSTPSINGTYTATRISNTQFSIPVNVTVAGIGGKATAARGILAESLEDIKSENSVGSFRCTIIASTIAFFEPAIGQEIVDLENGAGLFGGIIRKVTISAATTRLGGEIRLEIEAVSFDIYGSYRYVTATVPAGTSLKAAMTTYLLPYVTGYGVAIDAGQATGPTLPVAFVWDGVLWSECVRQLSDATLWPSAIDYAKQWSMVDPTTTFAPYDISTANRNASGGDTTVEVTQPDSTPNRIIVKYGTAVELSKTTNFVGDGVTTTFPLDYLINGPIPYTSTAGAVGLAVVAISGNESLGGTTAGLIWQYDPTVDPPTIFRSLGAPANLLAFSITYNVQFPQQVISENLADQAQRGIIEKIITEPDVYDRALAKVLGDNELASALAQPRTIKYPTKVVGILKPGMTQVFTVAERALAGVAGVITEVSTRHMKGSFTQRIVTAVEGTAVQTPVYRTVVQSWLGDGTATSTGPPSGSPVWIGPAGAEGDVQFWHNGVFGADTGLFTYDLTTHFFRANNIESQVGTNLLIRAKAPAQASGATAGKDLSLSASPATVGSGAGTAAGGAVTIIAGAAVGQTSGQASGGAVTITGGVSKGFSNGSVGGAINLAGGAGVHSGLGVQATGGAVNITGGAGDIGGQVIIKGGAGSTGIGASGDITIAGGNDNGGGSINPGSVTIKSGDLSNSSSTFGLVLITTGATFSSVGSPFTFGDGYLIKMFPAAYPTGPGNTHAQAPGGGVLIAGGAGQAGALTGIGGNDTAMAGGVLTLVGGVGGAETVAGSTRTGGAGGKVTITGGAGGAAPAAGGTTNIGGAGADVEIAGGTGGTGSTSNGAPGRVKISGLKYPLTDGSSGDTIVTDGAGTLSFAPGSGAINQLIGDVAAGPGAGSQVATLATVLGSPGVYGDASNTPVVTVDAKGRVTGISTVASSGASGSFVAAAPIVTTSNLTVVVNTGMVVPESLEIGAGFILTIEGGARLEITGPAVLAARLSPIQIDVVNTTAETALCTIPFPANFFSTAKQLVRVELCGDMQVNGGSDTLTFRIKLGTTVLYQDGGAWTNDADFTTWRLSLFLFGDPTGTTQYVNAQLSFGSRVTPTAGSGSINTTGFFYMLGGFATENPVSALNFSITVQHSAASASNRFRQFYSSIRFQ